MSSPLNLLKDPILSLLWKIGLPAGIGFFFSTIFNVVDAFWAGKLGIASATAMSQTFPIFLLIVVAGTGLAGAASALVGNAIGSGEKQRITRIIEHLAILGLGAIVLLTPLLFFWAPKLLLITGSDATSIQQLSLEYIRPIIVFGGLFIMGSLMNGILNAYGDTRTYGRLLIIGALVNIILDPLMMFGIPGYIPGLGIGGVAWATILIQIFIGVSLYRALIRRDIVSDCRWLTWRPDGTIIREIFRIAIPASLSMIGVAVGIFIINAFLKDFGTTVMAIYGVGTRIEQLVLLPTIGLAVAAASIIAQNNGAGNFDRVRTTYRITLIAGSLIIIPFALGVLLGSGWLYTFFIQGTTPEDIASIRKIGSEYTLIVSGLFWGYIPLFVTIQSLQAIKRPFFGLWIGLIRQIILPLIVFTLVTRYGGDYRAIWWSIFGIVWFSAIIAVSYGWRTLRKCS